MLLYMPKSEEREDHDQNRKGLFDPEFDKPETPLPLTVTSRVLYMLGDLTAGPAFKFTQWLELVRKRTSNYRSFGFPRRPSRLDLQMPLSAGESDRDTKAFSPCEQATEISLWERLDKAAMLDIESSPFPWERLSSLHHTEHNDSTEPSEDDTSKALEVTVNSGGVVFFALFNQPENICSEFKEAAAVIKFSSSRMATQSERLGYEFAKWLGVQTPQARVIHNCSTEWLRIKEAAEKARDAAASEGDEVGEITCSELLEALELSRCLFLMSYVHGSPLMEKEHTFQSRDGAEKIAAALGRILMLDLVIRNEDRLPCRQLGWRGNFANLLYSDNITSADMDVMEDACNSAIKRYGPSVMRALQKERRSTSIDCRLDTHSQGLESRKSDLSDVMESPMSRSPADEHMNKISDNDFNIVAIDSGVPHRPPAGKRASDQANYPKLVELLLNSSIYVSDLLCEITGGRLGSSEGDKTNGSHSKDMISICQAFRAGFRAAIRDLQGFQIFLLTVNQKLDNILRAFMSIVNRTPSGELDKEDFGVSESQFSSSIHFPSPCQATKDPAMNDNTLDTNDSESQRTTLRQSSSGPRDNSDSSSSRENSQGKYSKWSAEPVRGLRLTTKLKDFHKCAKVDAELSKELEQWNEMLRNDVIKLCQQNSFTTGFFEGSDNSTVVDAYEFKVRLEHILERISLISDAANTEKPASVTSSLFIGGALAARSVYTLWHLGMTHVLCLCSNEIGQSDSQFPDLFAYKNFSISDEEDSNISSYFEEACDFIDDVDRADGKVLVHCFEGRSRSATVVLSYLMLRKNLTLLEAWNTLRKVHRRAQPNDGFAGILLELDKRLYGKVSMEWQHRKPIMKICPICGKNAGLSSSSLKLHLQKAHKRLSSGSVDSAMTLEIQKAISALNLSPGGSPPHSHRETPLVLD